MVTLGISPSQVLYFSSTTLVSTHLTLLSSGYFQTHKKLNVSSSAFPLPPIQGLQPSLCHPKLQRMPESVRALQVASESGAGTLKPQFVMWKGSRTQLFLNLAQPFKVLFQALWMIHKN